VPAYIKAALVDFTGNPVSPHTMTGTGEEVNYGFFRSHILGLLNNNANLDSKRSDAYCSNLTTSRRVLLISFLGIQIYGLTVEKENRDGSSGLRAGPFLTFTGIRQ